MKGANNTYFGSIKEAVKTTVVGAKLTAKHLKDAFTKERRDATSADDANYFNKKEGIVTLQYPKEQIPVPDNVRYKLHNEMDDCIVCDKCAKICPVNCIDIEPIKSTETIGETSDGTPKRLYAAKFDIDMAKCCFCGLCTTVCPTECLTMTKEYDFSTFDINEMNFGFATLTTEEAKQKREAYEEAQAAKKAKVLEGGITSTKKPIAKKVVRPVAKKATEETAEVKPNPTFKPKIKAKPVTKKSTEDNKETDSQKPAFKPKMKARPVVKKAPEPDNDSENEAPKKSFKPKMKVRPVIKKDNTEEVAKDNKTTPTYKPKIKPVIKKAGEDEAKSSDEKPKYKPKARVKPVIKKKKDEGDSQ